MEDEAVVRVRPRPFWRYVGVGAGVHSNFGRLNTPRFAVELGWRVRTTPREVEPPPERPQLFLRTGIGWYGRSLEEEASFGGQAAVRMDLLPVSVGLQVRRAWSVMALWGGLGGEIVPYVGGASLEGQLVRRQVGILAPALTASVGWGVRVPGGELALEARASTLTSPGTDVSFQGYVGGLAIQASYRIGY